GGSNDAIFSSDAVGYVLRAGSTVIDAVATNSYSFPAAAGVTPADFSGTLTGSNAGFIRTASSDNNLAGDFTVSSASAVQTLGTYHSAVQTPSTFTYAWTPSADLDDPTIANPTASNLTTTTTFTVVATESVAGCSGSGSVTVLVGTPVAAAFSANDSNLCAGQTVTLTASASGGGGPYTYSVSDGTSQVSTTASTTLTPTTTTTYIVTVTDACTQTDTQAVTIVVNPAPNVSVTPNAASTCGTGSTTLTASGADTYTWIPTTSLTPTTGATVVSTTTITRTYTVTGTVTATGCTDTGRATITVIPPVVASASAAPATVCGGGSTVLSATTTYIPGYTVASTAYAPVGTPTTGVTLLASGGTATTALTSGDVDDGVWSNQTLPFTFNFYGANYTSISVGTNGHLVLGASTYTSHSGATAIPTTTDPDNAIHLANADLDLRNNTIVPATNPGVIEYFTVGVAPNRRFVVNYSNVPFFDYTAAADAAAITALGSVTVQAILNEGSNTIEIHTTAQTNTTLSKVQGVENAAGTQATATPGRNATTWSVSAPDAYVFTPGTLNYLWTPATGLSSTSGQSVPATPSNTTTYTVTVSDPMTLCSDTGNVTVVVNPIVAGTSLADSGETSTRPVGASGAFMVADTCELIASVVPAGASPLAGSVTATVHVDPIVRTANNQPYVQRHYDINPSNNAGTATATITLYATQAEFDAYNAYVTANSLNNPLLPTGGVDNGNVRINKVSGTSTTYTPNSYTPGVSTIITPATTWNSTNNWWEMTF
ncbi:MAG TPA: hypothetical protein VGB67_06375, partial [Fibrella sp.]